MRRNGSRGFTLIEILIAITILVIGVSGIIALFPSTIETASKVIEDTYAATVAQSVVESLASAQRDGRVYPALTNQPIRYMTFDHDGVYDTPPSGTQGPSYYSGNWTNTHVLLLPRSTATNLTTAATEPILLYPVAPSGNCPAGTPMDRSAGNLSSGATPSDVTVGTGNTTTDLKVTVDGAYMPWVRRVYALGQDGSGNVRVEYLPRDPTGATVAGSIPTDPYPQYSFALALRRIATDDNGSSGHADWQITSVDTYSDDLYEVRVMVFKNFKGDATTQGAIAGGSPIPRSNVPIRELVTFIELGPGAVSGSGVTGITINNHAPNQ